MSSTRGRASGSPAVPVIRSRGSNGSTGGVRVARRACIGQGRHGDRAGARHGHRSHRHPGLHQDSQSVARAGVRTTDVADAFRRAARRGAALTRIVSHDSYLINLATPDRALRKRSEASFRAELERCAALGIPARRLASRQLHRRSRRRHRAQRRVHHRAASARCRATVGVLLETTAGTGTALGSTFEELAGSARRDRRATCAHRIAFCADTCHLYSAGYDLRARLRRRLAAMGGRRSAWRSSAACTSTTRRRRSTPAATGTSSSRRARSAPSRSAASCAIPVSPVS